MPESFPFPQWGHQSFDERDLDSLLAGNTSDLPNSLRPVADTLNALRAAPSAGELHGEADARALFRGTAPGRGNPISGEIPVVPLQRGGRGRHGSARRPAHGWFAGLAAAAAVIAFGAGVTYTGHLPGPAQQLAHDTIAAPTPRMVSSSAAPGVQARSASPAPTERESRSATAAAPAPGTASPTPGAQSRKALCNAFWTDLEHPRPGPEPWRTPRYQQLITASGGERNVFGYCYPVWNPQNAPEYQTLPVHPPYFPRHWDFGTDHGQGQPGKGNGHGQGPAPGSQGNGGGDSGSSSAATPSDSASAPPPPSPQASANSDTGLQQQSSDTPANERMTNRTAGS